MWGNYWERRVCKLLNCPNLNQNSGCLLPELVSNLLMQLSFTYLIALAIEI